MYSNLCERTQTESPYCTQTYAKIYKRFNNKKKYLYSFAEPSAESLHFGKGAIMYLQKIISAVPTINSTKISQINDAGERGIKNQEKSGDVIYIWTAP